MESSLLHDGQKIDKSAIVDSLGGGAGGGGAGGGGNAGGGGGGGGGVTTRNKSLTKGT